MQEINRHKEKAQILLMQIYKQMNFQLCLAWSICTIDRFYIILHFHVDICHQFLL